MFKVFKTGVAAAALNAGIRAGNQCKTARCFRNIVIGAIFILSALGSGCLSHNHTGRHTTAPVDFSQRQQQSNRQYTLVSFDSDFPLDQPIIGNVLTVQEINKALVEQNPHRFGFSDEAIPIRVIALRSHGEIKTRANITVVTFILSLFTLPGYTRLDYKPTVKIILPDDAFTIRDLSGAVQYHDVQGISLYSPLGLIPGRNTANFQGERARGSGKSVQNDIRNSYIVTIAKEINALLDQFEVNQGASPSRIFSAVNVSNIRVQQSDEQLIVTYDLEGSADIEAYVSFDGGLTFRGPLQHVTGAVGRNIPSGRDKIFVWNVFRELGAVDYPNTFIKIEAKPPR